MKMTGDESACIATLNGQGKKLGENWGGGRGGDKASYDSCLIHSHNPKAVNEITCSRFSAFYSRNSQRIPLIIWE